MSKRTLVAAAALALTSALGGSAAAAGTVDPLKEFRESLHPCGGEIDYACRDNTGAFCTIWLGRCTVGE